MRQVQPHNERHLLIAGQGTPITDTGPVFLSPLSPAQATWIIPESAQGNERMGKEGVGTQEDGLGERADGVKGLASLGKCAT